MKKISLLIAISSLVLMACKKKNTDELTTQDLIDQGKNIIDLLELRPADSLIGLNYKGGIIFHIDTNDNSGMIVSSVDLNENAWWGCNGQDIAGTNGTAFGLGDSNTYKIVDQCNDASSAAAICYYSNLENYQDWYLPSEDEMKLIHSTLKPKNVGQFEDDYYWTSSQENQFYARYFLFLDGSSGFTAKSDVHRVRGVRNVN